MKLEAHIPFSPQKWPFFYGYFIVACSAVSLLMSAPGQTIGVSVFTDKLIGALNVSRFQLSLAYMFGTIGSSLIIRRAGRLLDSVGVRIVTMATAMLYGLTLVYMSRVDYVAQFVSQPFSNDIYYLVALVTVTIGFLLMRFTGQGVLGLAGRTMLMRWFIDLRGRMNSILGVFISITFSASPLFFDAIIQAYNWRIAWLILAGIIGVLFTIFVFFFFRDKPEDSGLLPDGRRHIDLAGNGGQEDDTWTLLETRRTLTFWIFNIGLAMFSLFLTAVTFHVVSIFKVAGYERSDAISIFLPTAIIAVVLNIAAGWMADSQFFKYRMKYLQMIMLFGLAASSLGVMLLPAAYMGRYLIIAGNGISQGFFGTVSNVVWPRYFGREHLGEIAGYNMSFLVFFSAIGPSIFGWSFDVTGNYYVASLVILVIISALFAVSMWANRPER